MPERAHRRAGARPDLGVAALAEQEQAALGEGGADRRRPRRAARCAT